MRELRTLGFDEAGTDGAGNVVARIAGTDGAPAVMLSSHLDVVDPGDSAAWEHGGAHPDRASGARGCAGDPAPDPSRHPRRHRPGAVPAPTGRGAGSTRAGAAVWSSPAS
jgi:hypothetical protein